MHIVAAIQMNSSADVEVNLNKAEGLIKQAAAQRAKLVVLPENFAFMGADANAQLAIAESFGDGPLQTFLSEQAKKHKVWLVGGTIPIKAEEPARVYSSSLLFNEQGELVARYNKLHLFDVTLVESNESYRESDYICPGDSVCVVDTPVGKVGMAVCYDLRFPELFRKMHEQNVEVIVLPSAFTETTGRAHWQILLRARAVENLSYIVAPDQAGTHASGRRTWGHSMILDPWGNVQRCLTSGVGVAFGEVDPYRQKSLRDSFPSIEHRRIKCEL